MLNWRIPLCLTVAAAAIIGRPAGVGAQRRYHPSAAAQYVGQEGPLGGSSGGGILVSVARDVGHGLAVGLAADFAALGRGDGISLCFLLPGGDCLSPPGRQSFLGLTATIELDVPLAARVHGFAALGPAYGRTAGVLVSGARRSWIQPSLEGGIRFGAEEVQWSVSARWRRVDPWLIRGPYRELGLIFGFRL